jgi:dolichyl-diphosphooligosaccharide--protein glycosyltransferase
MLDCSGVRSFPAVLNYTQDNTVKAYNILRESLKMTKQEAVSSFSKYMPAEEAARIADLTHCNPPEDYFITSDDMIGKAGVWAHFGSWSFERAFAYSQKGRDRDVAVADMVKTLDWTQEHASSIFDEVDTVGSQEEANTWVAPWPSYINGPAGCRMEDKLVLCDTAMLNLTTNEALVNVQGRPVHPRSAVFIDNGEFTVHSFNDSQVDVSAVFVPQNSGMVVWLVSPQLAASMFTRLYFFQGHGLSHFDLFDSERQLNGGPIYVWKVDWQGASQNKVYAPVVPQPVNSTGAVAA